MLLFEDIICVKVLGSTFEFTKHGSSCCTAQEIDLFLSIYGNVCRI